MLHRTCKMQSSLFQAGNEFQVEKLGKCGARCTEYKRWSEALAEAKRSQPARKTQFVLLLEVLLMKRLGVAVTVYTAIHSAFDIFHGVDAFVEVGRTIVTLDVTLNPEKVVAKADVVYHGDDGAVSLADRLADEVRRKAPRAARVA